MHLRRTPPGPTATMAFVGALLTLLTVLALLVAPGPAAAQEPPVIWHTYDVTLDLGEDGTVHVTEDQVIQFNGEFSTGWATLPMREGETIDNVTVSVQGEPLREVEPASGSAEPGTYWVSDATPGMLEVSYAFPRTRAGEAVRVVLAYDISGAIRPAPDGAENGLRWIAIGPEVTEVGPIRRATVRVTLPEAMAADGVSIAPDDATRDGRTWTWTRIDLAPGEAFEIMVLFPAVAMPATPVASPIGTPPATPVAAAPTLS